MTKHLNELVAGALLLLVNFLTSGCGGGAGLGTVTSLTEATTSAAPTDAAPGSRRASAHRVPPGPPIRIDDPNETMTSGVIEVVDDSTVRLEFQPGWNLVSVPLASVTTTANLPSPWYAWDGAGYRSFQPDREPAELRPDVGYFVWAPMVQTGLLAGTALEAGSVSLALAPGWNLVAFQAELTSGEAFLIDQASWLHQLASAVSEDETQPVYRYASTWDGQAYQELDLAEDTTVLPTGPVWLYAHQGCELRYMVGDGGPPPGGGGPGPIDPGLPVCPIAPPEPPVWIID